MVDIAELEGLAIGLDQRGEKSAAHRIRLAIKELEHLRSELKEIAEMAPMQNVGTLAALMSKRATDALDQSIEH